MSTQPEAILEHELVEQLTGLGYDFALVMDEEDYALRISFKLFTGICNFA